MNGFRFLLKLTNDTPCEGYNLVLWVYYVDCWNLDQSYHILPPDPKTSISNKLSITLPAVKHIAEGSILMSKANSFQLTLMYCELLKGFRLRFSQKMMTLELNWPQFMALPYCSAWHFSPAPVLLCKSECLGNSSGTITQSILFTTEYTGCYSKHRAGLKFHSRRLQ